MRKRGRLVGGLTPRTVKQPEGGEQTRMGKLWGMRGGNLSGQGPERGGGGGAKGTWQHYWQKLGAAHHHHTSSLGPVALSLSTFFSILCVILG